MSGSRPGSGFDLFSQLGARERKLDELGVATVVKSAAEKSIRVLNTSPLQVANDGAVADILNAPAKTSYEQVAFLQKVSFSLRLHSVQESDIGKVYLEGPYAA
jgi:hypothetical protein